MPSKRLPLTFSELEPKGRKAILRTAEEVKAEEALLASQNTGIPESQKASIPASQNSGIPEQPADRRKQYPKATYRLSPEAIEAIDDAKRILRRDYKIKTSLEEIAEQAILAAYNELLVNQQTSFLVNQLSRKPESQKHG